MALVVKDRVKETTTTTGTGAVTLAGAETNYIAFSAALSDGDTTYYAIVDDTNSDWEVGLGTYASAGNTLTRTTILASSNAGSAVNLGAGTKSVFVTYAADKSVYLDASGNVASVTITSADINGGTIDGTTIGGTTAAAGTFTTFTSTGIDDNATSTAITIDSSQNVGIGDGTISATLDLHSTTAGRVLAVEGSGGKWASIVSGTGTTGPVLAFDNTSTRFRIASGSDKLGTGLTEIFTVNTGGVTFEKAIEEQQYSLTGTAIDPSNGTIQYKTLSANTTFTESLADGEYVTLMIDDGAGYTVTWPTTTWVGGSAPTLETTGYNVIELWQVNGTLYGAFVGAA